ncbi:nucleoside deaminase [Mycolicibacterium rhodesiae]|uniref:tRNA-specific adenosine deaminase n=1 Tax=Mycolicibacterium rhodesiae TaxID=36814 RepID=A0A1X0IVH5_MYCRH|nr:nucleoside deaminase [Mycolicibacterium rhodesiae]MCV7343032.1 nucleoside deaminase [Mycolicibacterium rhodesiae]ORB52963.1 tRNA-specific adenosine deaminase [Mycolicibacterium rhodesiae]
MALDDQDIRRLGRCVELARTALNAGDEPFGSILVDEDGTVLFEDHNHVAGGDATAHPELAIAQWSAANLSPDQRARATVYTSGEHCPMCAAAHAWVGLGRIVFAVAGAQLGQWLATWQAPLPPVATLPITTIAPHLTVDGPASGYQDEMKSLYKAKFAP